MNRVLETAALSQAEREYFISSSKCVLSKDVDIPEDMLAGFTRLQLSWKTFAESLRFEWICVIGLNVVLTM